MSVIRPQTAIVLLLRLSPRLASVKSGPLLIRFFAVDHRTWTYHPPIRIEQDWEIIRCLIGHTVGRQFERHPVQFELG